MKSKINSWLLLLVCAICTTPFHDAFGSSEVCYTYSWIGNYDQTKIQSGTWCDNYTKCYPGCYCTGKPTSDFYRPAWDTEFNYLRGTNLDRLNIEEICRDHAWPGKNRGDPMFMLMSEHWTATAMGKQQEDLRESWRHIIGDYSTIRTRSDSDKLNLMYRIMHSVGMDPCPSEFPKSEKGAASAEDCYVEIVSGQKVYNKRSTCSSGTYLPAGHNDCLPCKTDGVHYCPGGTFAASTKKASGISECPFGQKANDKHTGCVTDKPLVPAGSYLRANDSTPTPCKTDKNYYCPGGEYKVSKKDQGIYECPKGSRPNDTKSACKKLVSKDLMMQCFLTVEDPNKYKNCLTGSRYYK